MKAPRGCRGGVPLVYNKNPRIPSMTFLPILRFFPLVSIATESKYFESSFILFMNSANVPNGFINSTAVVGLIPGI